MGLKGSKAVFLQLQIKDKEMEGKWENNNPTIQALTFLFIVSNCNMSFMSLAT